MLVTDQFRNVRSPPIAVVLEQRHRLPVKVWGIIRAAVPIACALLASCDRPSTKSAVGDWQVAPHQMLAKETVRLWFRDLRSDQVWPNLSYTIEPGGGVLMEKGREFPEHIDASQVMTDARATRKLTDEDYRRLLAIAAKLRPEKLNKDGPFTLPNGCGFIFHRPSSAGLSFQTEHEGGGFILPAGCKHQDGRVARRLLLDMRAIMQPYFDRRSP